MSGSKFGIIPIDAMLSDDTEDSDVQAGRKAAMLDASRKIALICADLLDFGLTEQTVAEAMMGATIHFYDAAGLGDSLPATLRLKADRIQQILLKKGDRTN